MWLYKLKTTELVFRSLGGRTQTKQMFYHWSTSQPRLIFCFKYTFSFFLKNTWMAVLCTRLSVKLMYNWCLLELRKDHLISWGGLEPGSSARAAGALDWWAISPVPVFPFFLSKKYELSSLLILYIKIFNITVSH